MNLETLELIQLQIRLEYQLDYQKFLVPFPSSTEQALYIVYRHVQGYLPYFSHLLPNELRQRLMKLGPVDAFNHPGKVKKVDL